MIQIEISTTALRVKANADGCLIGAPNISVFPFLRNELVEYEYDHRAKKYTPKYNFFYYNRDTNTLNIPRHLYDAFVVYLRNNGTDVRAIRRYANDHDRISIRQISDFEDRDYQARAIKFLCSDEEMKALELQTGCLAGDTIIDVRSYNRSFQQPISELYYMWRERIYDQPYPYLYVRSYDNASMQLIWHKVSDIVYSGIKKVYLVKLRNGLILKCTADHLIMTKHDGWVEAQHISGLLVTCNSDRLDGEIVYSEALSVEYIGEEPTYDIVCEDPHHNFVANGMVVHNSGKSYIAIRSIIELNLKTIVVLPAFLVNQWTEVIAKHTDAKVYEIRGSNSVFSLFDNKELVDQTDIFLASVNTMQEYAQRNNSYEVAPPISEFFKYLRVGIKIVDECHINFYANTLIDVQSDIRHNIYLSATYMRSAKDSDRIFRKIFPDKIKFDNEVKANYVNITQCQYATGPIPDKKISTDRGYSQYKYEKYLMRHPRMLNSVLSSIRNMIDRFYLDVKKPKQKLLVLVGLVDFADLLKDWLSNALNDDLMISEYVHSTDDEVLDQADIIISTIGSCGTGKDLSNLRTMISFISFASMPLTLQTLGRLRKLPDDTPEFVYMVNIDIKHHIHHSYSRQKIYRQVAKQFITVEV